MIAPLRHGGDEAGVRRRLGLGDRPLLDASASFNPLGPPPGVMRAARRAFDRVHRYPDPGSPRLTERLAEWHGVPVENVLVGAGTTEIISLIGQCLRQVLALHARELGDPGMALSHLIEPTYGEYRRASALNDLRLEVWSKHVLGWRQDFLPRSAAGIFWTGHPNNPTGRAWDRETLLPLIDDTQSLLVVVDEAYLPFLADEEDRSVVAAAATRSNLLALRSLTKVYCIPDMRVGYAVGSADMITRLRQFQDPWSVCAVAEAAALASLEASDEYLSRTRSLIAAEAARLVDRLWDVPGLRPAWPGHDRPADAPGLPNFLLVSLTDSPLTTPQLHDALAHRGVLIRDCTDYHGLEVGALLTGPDQLIATRGNLRIGVRTPEENDRVLAALEGVMRDEC